MSVTPTERQLLNAIHELDKNAEKRITSLETKIDDGINGRFKDNERRITNLETNQNKFVWGIISAVIVALMALILK